MTRPPPKKAVFFLLLSFIVSVEAVPVWLNNGRIPPGSLYFLLQLQEKSVIITFTNRQVNILLFEGNDIVKIIKLILGILCILLAGFVAFQSFFLGSGNALFKPLEVSGTIAIIIIALMSICGLTMTFTFRSSGVGGEVFCILLLSLATVAGVLFRGNIPELRPWTWICLALDVINLLFLFAK